MTLEKILAVTAVVSLVLMGSIAYVVGHFIMKFW
jgi:hypothetical protein